MSAAMTNEERFVASCVREGEVCVRQKLSAGKYSERRTAWASNWLEQIESGKSEATKADEKSRANLKATQPNRLFVGATSALGLMLLLGGAIVFLTFR